GRPAPRPRRDPRRPAGHARRRLLRQDREPGCKDRGQGRAGRGVRQRRGEGSVERARRGVIRSGGFLRTEGRGGAPARVAGARRSYSLTIGQVSVRVTPSTPWIFTRTA